jgi:hypothetical protein
LELIWHGLNFFSFDPSFLSPATPVMKKSVCGIFAHKQAGPSVKKKAGPKSRNGTALRFSDENSHASDWRTPTTLAIWFWVQILQPRSPITSIVARCWNYALEAIIKMLLL